MIDKTEDKFGFHSVLQIKEDEEICNSKVNLNFENREKKEIIDSDLYF